MRGLFLFCILLSLPGCPDGVRTISEDGHCGGEIRCPDDLVCAPTIGACVQDQEGNVQGFGLQGIPPAELGLLADQWAVKEAESVPDYAFPAPLRVSGVIKELGNPLAPSLPAQIIGESDGLIPGTILGIDARAIEGVNEDFEAFEMNIIPNRQYRFYVFPDDEDRPPQMEEKVFVENESDYLISLPAKEGAFAYPRVTGKLMISPQSGQDETELTPAENVFVFAEELTVDAESAGASTQAFPETKLGGFELRFPPGTANYQFWAKAVVEENSLTSVVPLTALQPEGGKDIVVSGNYGDVTNIGTLYVNPRPLVPLLIRVETEETLVPVDQASIHLSAVLSDKETVDWYGTSGSFSPGVWQGLIPAGEYTLVITPPRSSGMARVTEAISVGLDTPEWTFQLTQMNALTGVVVGWGGTPLSKASLSFISLENPRSPPIEARASSQGTFEVNLSPGQYKGVITPTDGEKIARFRIPPFTVGEETPTDLKLQAPPPRLVEGRMLDPTGAPLPRTRVEVYDLEKGAQDLLLHEAILGEGMTNDSGVFRILVSSDSGVIVEQEYPDED